MGSIPVLTSLPPPRANIASLLVCPSASHRLRRCAPMLPTYSTYIRLHMGCMWAAYALSLMAGHPLTPFWTFEKCDLPLAILLLRFLPPRNV